MRLDLSKNANGVRPAVALVVGSAALAGEGKGLAREPRRDDIHEATPGSPVEGADVVPDREQGKQTVPLAAQEDFPTVGFDFHRADGAKSE